MRLDVYCIVVFLGIAFLSGMACRNSTVGIIKEIGTISRYSEALHGSPQMDEKIFSNQTSCDPAIPLLQVSAFALLFNSWTA